MSSPTGMMPVPTSLLGPLAARLLEFALDHHHDVMMAATASQGEIRAESKQSLAKGIEDVLGDGIEDLQTSDTPPPTTMLAPSSAAQAIWDLVLETFDRSVWIDSDEKIVFFAQWETRFMAHVEDLLQARGVDPYNDEGEKANDGGS